MNFLIMPMNLSLDIQNPDADVESQRMTLKEAAFTSVWAGYEITTTCHVNTITREVFDIEKVYIPTDEDGDELEILDREYVTVDGIEYCVKNASSETEGWNPDRDYWYK